MTEIIHNPFMRSFGIDIGQQTVEIGEWTEDCYGLSSDGVAKLFSNDSSKDSSRYPFSLSLIHKKCNPVQQP